MKKAIKKFYEIAVENSGDGIYFVDNRRKILYWNKAAEEITGFTASEIVGSHCYRNILRHMDDYGNLLCLKQCPLVESMKKGRVINKSVYLHDKKGSRIPVSVEVFPVRNSKGKVVGAVERFNISLGLSLTRETIIKLQREAYLDHLTQVPNRRYLELKLKEAVNEVKLQNASIGLLMGDIDEFKKFNDLYGHLLGDAVLKAVSHTLLWNVKPVDTVARYGGDEFVIILKDVDKESLYKVARKLQILVLNSKVRHENSFLEVSMSFGGTIINPEDSDETVIKRADCNLLRAKDLEDRIVIS
ncbi:MAG: sensor domain-containing diguanylate cyclase [Candidatus Hydrothermia bacterium]